MALTETTVDEYTSVHINMWKNLYKHYEIRRPKISIYNIYLYVARPTEFASIESIGSSTELAIELSFIFPVLLTQKWNKWLQKVQAAKGNVFKGTVCCEKQAGVDPQRKEWA